MLFCLEILELVLLHLIMMPSRYLHVKGILDTSHREEGLYTLHQGSASRFGQGPDFL